ncbi:unnamed protein product [Callosobruchus maculatus]|uniref:C2H2-type domain-containing protein n=1 Tax=Callosobruchus maculatus TaxID=64391 RepID=A0A653DCU9_CALMS|nr:unnamed protein product [Callosobruchus maculatus]
MLSAIPDKDAKTKLVILTEEPSDMDLLDQKPLKTYCCDLCNYETNHKDRIKSHSLVHDKAGKPLYKCDICDFKSYHKASLRSHGIIHDTRNKKLYRCSFCNYTTYRQRNFSQHKLVHDQSGQPLYICDTCQYQTYRRHNMVAHQLVHTKREVKLQNCDICDGKTYYLGRHTRAVHPNRYQPEKCSHCDQSYNTKRSLKHHILQAHPLVPDVSSINQIFSCEHCKYKTNKCSNLTSHMLTHDFEGELFKYKCTICDYKTPRKHSYGRHMKGHEKVKEFVCSDCGKEFLRKSCFDEHILTYHVANEELLETITHTIHFCQICEFRTTIVSKLMVHYKKKHPKTAS